MDSKEGFYAPNSRKPSAKKIGLPIDSGSFRELCDFSGKIRIFPKISRIEDVHVRTAPQSYEFAKTYPWFFCLKASIKISVRANASASDLGVFDGANIEFAIIGYLRNKHNRENGLIAKDNGAFGLSVMTIGNLG
jgi:hypothetical protein